MYTKKRHARIKKRLSAALAFAVFLGSAAPAFPAIAHAEEVALDETAEAAELVLDETAEAEEAPEAYDAAKKDCAKEWKRLGGANATQTMAEIVDEGFEQSNVVVIAASGGYKDALAASGLAGSFGAPILLTKRDSLNAACKQEISRLKAKKAFIIGGTQALGENVEAELKGLGLAVERVMGTTAPATSCKIAMRLGKSKTVIIASSTDFADALSIAPWAYANMVPIILANKSGKLDKGSLSTIRDIGAKTAIIVGGKAAVSQECEGALSQAGLSITRLSGSNACDTSAKIAAWELENGFTLSQVGIATRSSFKDALSAAALMGKARGPILLASENNKAAIKATISGACESILTGYVFGGEAAVSAATFEYALDAHCTHNGGTASADKPKDDAKAKKLAAARQAVEDAQLALDDVKGELETSILAYKTAKSDAGDRAQSELDAALASQAEANTIMEDKRIQVEQAQIDYDEAVRLYEEALAGADPQLFDDYNSATAGYEEALAANTKAGEELAAAQDNVANKQKAYEDAKARRDSEIANLNKTVDDYNAAKNATSVAYADLESAKAALNDAKNNGSNSAVVREAERRVTEAQAALKKAKNEQENAQFLYDAYKDTYGDAQAAYDKAVTEYNSAKSAKTSADNAVKTANDKLTAAKNTLSNLEKQRADQEAARTAAQKAYDTAKENVDKASKTAETAVKNMKAAEQALINANEAYEKAAAGDAAAIKKGSRGFFESLGNDGANAVALFSRRDKVPATGEIIQNFTHMGAADDATGLENMKKALETLKHGYDVVRNDPIVKKNGYAPWKVTNVLMATAQLYVNWEAQNYQHARALNVGENLHCTTRDPYIGWYDDEKISYETHDGGQTGHYESLVCGYKATGFACTQTEESPYCKYNFYTWSQTFTNYTNRNAANGNEKLYDFDEYYSLFMAYYRKVMPGDTTALKAAITTAQNNLINAQSVSHAAKNDLTAKQTALTNAKTTLDNAKVTVDTTSAKNAVTTAQNNLNSAKANQTTAADKLSKAETNKSNMNTWLTEAKQDYETSAANKTKADSNLKAATDALNTATAKLTDARSNAVKYAEQNVSNAEKAYSAATANENTAKAAYNSTVLNYKNLSSAADAAQKELSLAENDRVSCQNRASDTNKAFTEASERLKAAEDLCAEYQILSDESKEALAIVQQLRNELKSAEGSAAAWDELVATREAALNDANALKDAANSIDAASVISQGTQALPDPVDGEFKTSLGELLQKLATAQEALAKAQTQLDSLS